MRLPADNAALTVIGGDMLYEIILDFAFVALLFCSAVFPVCCWMAFREDREAHPNLSAVRSTSGQSTVERTSKALRLTPANSLFCLRSKTLEQAFGGDS
jgi:hypothetical protein